MSIDKIRNIGLDKLVTQVYDFDGLTTDELMCKFAQKINIIIEHFNYLDKQCQNNYEALKLKLEYLLGQGVEKEVAKKIIELINDGTLGDLINESLLADINAQLDNIVHKLYGAKNYNIIDYGAVGDGITDNTQAFIKAFKEIPNNSTLIIPNGEYIVYKDNDGSTQANSVSLDKCILLKNKENITIIGEGNVLIRPNNQGVSATKKKYPCTISIDQCKNVVIKNINIESKGESYGDADSGSGLTHGDGRTNFNIQNGGSAIHVSRSKNVKIYDGKFRFCGSCAVVYFSSVSNCGIYNSFSNPASLGYASYAIDTWADGSDNYSNDVEIINCSSWAETVKRDGNIIGSTKYSSKASVAIEGDGNLCKANIKGCTFKNCYANSADKYLGMAILCYNADVICENNIIENCACALYKRDMLSNDGIVRFINNTCTNLTTNGIVIKDLYSLKHTKEDIISNNYIHVVGGVVWNDIPYLAHNHGIVQAEVRDGEGININNNTIKVETGRGIVKHFKGSVKITNNNIITANSTLDLYDGGEIIVNNNSLTMLENENDEHSIVYVNTASIENSIYDNVRMTFTNNTLIGDKITRQAIAIISTNVGILFEDKGIKNNNYINCVFNLNKSNYKLKNEMQYVKMISRNELMGDNTVLKLSFVNKNIYNNIKIIDNNGNIRSCVYYSINENENYEVVYTISGDVREHFTNGVEYIIM